MKRLILILSIALIACDKEETVTPLDYPEEVKVSRSQDKAPNALTFEGGWVYPTESLTVPRSVIIKAITNTEYSFTAYVGPNQLTDTLYHTSATRLKGKNTIYGIEINLYGTDLNLDMRVPYNNQTYFINQNYLR